MANYSIQFDQNHVAGIKKSLAVSEAVQILDESRELAFWAINEAYAGHKIALINETAGTYKVIKIPFLENARRNGTDHAESIGMQTEAVEKKDESRPSELWAVSGETKEQMKISLTMASLRSIKDLLNNGMTLLEHAADEASSGYRLKAIDNSEEHVTSTYNGTGLLQRIYNGGMSSDELEKLFNSPQNPHQR